MVSVEQREGGLKSLSAEIQVADEHDAAILYTTSTSGRAAFRAGRPMITAICATVMGDMCWALSCYQEEALVRISVMDPMKLAAEDREY